MFKNLMNIFEQEIKSLLETPGCQLKSTLKGIELCNKILAELKAKIEKEDFETVDDEILFFKDIKPEVMSYLIYFTEVRSCETRKPKAGASFQIRFFEKELKRVNKFFYRNIDFSYYMELGHTYLDHQIFTRNSKNDFPFTPLVNYYQFPE